MTDTSTARGMQAVAVATYKERDDWCRLVGLHPAITREQSRILMILALHAHPDNSRMVVALTHTNLAHKARCGDSSARRAKAAAEAAGVIAKLHKSNGRMPDIFVLMMPAPIGTSVTFNGSNLSKIDASERQFSAPAPDVSNLFKSPNSGLCNGAQPSKALPKYANAEAGSDRDRANFAIMPNFDGKQNRSGNLFNSIIKEAFQPVPIAEQDKGLEGRKIVSKEVSKQSAKAAPPPLSARHTVRPPLPRESRAVSYKKVALYYPTQMIGDEKEAFATFEMAIENGSTISEMILEVLSISSDAHDGVAVPSFQDFLLKYCR